MKIYYPRYKLKYFLKKNAHISKLYWKDYSNFTEISKKKNSVKNDRKCERCIEENLLLCE